MAKNFDKIDKKAAGTGLVHDALEHAAGNKGRQKTVSAEEKQKRLSERRTQGRKGCVQQRITMTFSPENYEFLHVVSKATGKTMVGIVNALIESYRNQNPELFEQAKSTLAIMEKGLSDNINIDL